MYEDIIVIDYLDRAYSQGIELTLILQNQRRIQNWNVVNSPEEIAGILDGLTIEGPRKIIHFLGHGAVVGAERIPFGFCRSGDNGSPEVPIPWTIMAEYLHHIQNPSKTNLIVNFMSVCHSHGIRDLFNQRPFSTVLYGTTNEVSMSKGFNIYDLNLNFNLFKSGFGNDAEANKYFKEP